MDNYYTFKRSCTGWHDFSTARKITCAKGLTIEQARQMCDDFNRNRSDAQVKAGTKMEFTTA